MSRVPRIRFKGFEEDGEQRKLGEVANRFDSTRIPISENLRVLGNTPYYGANGIQDYIDGYTHDGEYVLIAEDGANDLKNYPIRLVKGRIWVNNHAHVIQGIEKIMNNQFINFAMSQVDFESIVVGCGRAKLNAEQLMDICFKIPNKNEQANIGRLFDSLDHLITLHQRKLEKLKIIKKSMLENLFPQNGEKTPKIRLSGFTEDWEQRKLGEIAERIIRKNEKLESTLPLTISAQYGLIDQNEFFDKRIASKDVRGYYLIKKGEFAYNKSTSVDAPLGAIKRLDKYKNGVLSTLYILFKIIDDTSTSSDYLVTYYATDLWHRGIQSIAAEGARNHGLLNIAPNDFFETMLSIPLNISEQKKVGDFFISFDHLITLHQSKLEKLQKIKKSMLESMFV